MNCCGAKKFQVVVTFREHELKRQFHVPKEIVKAHDIFLLLAYLFWDKFYAINQLGT